MWGPVLCLRPITHRIMPCRHKKYYRTWRIPYSLDDFQTMALSKPNPYEAWNQEWSDSTVPKALQWLDICRLPNHLKLRLRPQSSFFVARSPVESTLDYKRRLFGKYGLASGVDPAVLFLDNRILEYEKALEQATERPVSEVLEEEEQRRIAAEKQINELMANIDKNLEKMPEMIKKFESSMVKQQALNKQQDERTKAIMEEARDRFGYYVSPRDPKFQKIREEFEEREKLAKKMQKKLKK